MKFKRWSWLCPVSLCILAACNTVRPDADNTIPPGLIFQDHVLADKIFAVKTNQKIDEAGLMQAISAAEYILIGETHDNTRHHQIQAGIMDFLALSNSSASVAFEMIDTEQGRMLGLYKITSPDMLITILNQHPSGWEYELYYRDLFDSVIRAGFSIMPANIVRKRLVEMMEDGQGNLTAEHENILSRFPLAPQTAAAMEREIIDAHCGMLTREQAQPMLRGQRIRDVTMAMNLTGSNALKKILIAGNGHVRNDWGVPKYLNDGRDHLVTVGLLEVDTGRNAPADYSEFWQNHELPFDYVWFTAQADRDDPCASYKQTHQRN